MDLEKETSEGSTGMAFNPDADRRSAVGPGRRSQSDLSLEIRINDRFNMGTVDD